jgi:hypothetical protein
MSNIINKLKYKILSPWLTAFSNSVIQDAKKNSSWSSSIPGAIGSAKIEEKGSRLSIRVTINLKQAPMAAAFEHGSGVHNKTNPDTYAISATNKLLKFPFTLTFMPGIKLAGVKGKHIGQVARILNGDQGQVSGEMFWNYVDHPGVAARPYMKPAIDSNLDSFKQKLLKGISSGVNQSIVETWYD